MFSRIAAYAITFIVVAATPALATFDNYSFTAGTGSRIDPTAGTVHWSNTAGATTIRNQVRSFSIGFTFRFHGVDYTQASVSTNGVIGFGSTLVTSAGVNTLASVNVPAIAPWWDTLSITNGGPCRWEVRIRTLTTGSAPNRICVIDYQNIAPVQRGVQRVSFQARLYERTGVIEYWYGRMIACDDCNFPGTQCNNTSASIGLVAGSSFMSATPAGGATTVSTATANDALDLNGTSAIAENTLYTFAPCAVSPNGRTADGGSSSMLDGDVLLSGRSVMRGSAAGYTPFDLQNAGGTCGSRTVTYTFSGPSASEYQIATPVTVNPGSTTTPLIMFRPTGTGIRSATLTVSDDTYFVRNYQLAAAGIARIAWQTNIAQGGSLALLSGDTLLTNRFVLLNSSADVTPMTLANINPDPTQPAASITVSIDSAGGPSTQYSIVGASSASLGPNATFTPVIRFNPSRLGPQIAHLRVTADGETRLFILAATAVSPRLNVVVNGTPSDGSEPLYRTAVTCVADNALESRLDLSNAGELPLIIDAIRFYEVDTLSAQSFPAPYQRERGRVIPSIDYTLSTTSGGRVNPTIPFTLAPGEQRTLYVRFSAARPGRRNARMLIRSNASNIAAIDTAVANQQASIGLFALELAGSGTGGSIASGEGRQAVQPVVFPPAMPGVQNELNVPISNRGACDLRINKARLRITTGDVNEFTIISALTRTPIDQTTGDFILAPGASDSIRIRFAPSRSGTRMARLRIVTNDSSIGIPGITERGTVYLDLHGEGRGGIHANRLNLSPVIVGSSVAGVATIENTGGFGLEILSVQFEGTDAAQFAEDASRPWVTLPTFLAAGAKLSFGVRLSPTGAAGIRRANLVVITTTRDTARVVITGEAGTRSLMLAPTTLFDDVQIAVGQTFRRSVAITNTGTMPIRIASVGITGVDASSYRLGSLPRVDLEPGSTEYLEVTFAPTASGAHTARIDVVAIDGSTYSVDLGGIALRARGGIGDPTVSAGIANPTPGLLRDSEPTLR
ncbi:MAG: choice-of-anchor D domain-containing protein [bacterium]|nr:choice-of-anchor D domain-containing protein [Candidatus Kapabacteria bacterium]